MSANKERFIIGDRQQFDLEQDEFLKFLLNERFFKPWQIPRNNEGQIENREYSLVDESVLEIFLTAKCNQNCQYCYLVNNPGLYPKEADNKENILKNLQHFLNYLEEQRFYIPQIEFYTGEIWHSNFGLEVLEMTYQCLLKGEFWTDYILIPSNCSFVMNEAQLSKIQRFIDKYNQIGVRLAFSISIDGKPVESSIRPLNNGNEKDDDYYDRLFLFAQHNTFYFHPMISAIDIDKWIENYKWWDMMCKKYNMDVDEVVMTLEVRNNDWTDEALQHYCNYMDFLLENFKEKYNNNVISMTDSLFSLSGQGGGYVVYAPAEAETFLGCTISNSLTVRIGDLAICPCHRTAYNKFLYGFFKQNENGRIVDIQAVNPQMAARVLYSNLQLSSFGCDACQYVDYCLRGCLGSQYENMNDPFMPISGVCKLFKTKWSHLVKKFNEYGIIDYLQTISPYHPSYLRITKFLNFAKGVLENNGLG